MHMVWLDDPAVLPIYCDEARPDPLFEEPFGQMDEQHLM